MGNQINNFSNKSQQLAPYDAFKTEQRNNLTYLRGKQNHTPYLMKTITTNSQQKCRSIKDMTMKKTNIKQVPVTHLEKAFVQQLAQYCSTSYKINLIFQISDISLQKDILHRKSNKTKYTQEELVGLIQNILLALHFYKQIEQPYESISPRPVLADPLICKEEFIYHSPQKIALIKDAVNVEQCFDWFVSDLFSLGVLVISAYYLEPMEDLYKEKKFNKTLLQSLIKNIQYSYIQKIVKDLTGPPRLRSQVVAEFKFQQHKYRSELKIDKPQDKRLNKKQIKKQIQRQIHEAKQQVKKIIQTNSIKQMVKPVSIQRPQIRSVQKRIPLPLIQHNYQHQNSQTKHELKNIVAQSPRVPKIVIHHCRSNSQQLPTSNFQIKPSTASTVCLQRDSSNGLLQSIDLMNYKQRESFIKVLDPSYQNLLKQRNGALNTSVSSHGIMDNFNSMISYSSQKYDTLVKNQNKSIEVMNNQFSSVYHKSIIDNSSLVFNQSRVSIGSNHSVESNKSNLSKKSHNQSKNDESLKPSTSQILSGTIINKYDPRQDSLLYSKSVSREKIHPNQYSLDFPTFARIQTSNRNSRNNSIEEESRLLASRKSNTSIRSHHSIHSVQSSKQQIINQNSKQSIASSHNGSGSDSYRYEGTYKNKLKSGEGKLYNHLGKLIYDGEWSLGLYHGYGKVFNQHFVTEPPNFKDLSLDRGNWIEYEGSFKNNEKHGFGKIVFVNGQAFEGEFLNNAVSGFGQYFKFTGEVIDGIWERGKLKKEI